MVLFVQPIGRTDEREFFRLNTMEDFRPLFDRYPTTEQIALMSTSVEDAAQAIAKYLSAHHMDAWIEDGALAKGIRDMALGLGMAAATAMAPAGAMAHQQATQPQGQPQAPVTAPAVPQASASPAPAPSAVPKIESRSPAMNAKAPDVPEFGTQPEDKFLWTIAQIESGGGRNTKHAVMRNTPGLVGVSAMGTWGMLPPTIKEMVERKRQLGQLKPDEEKLGDMNQKQLKEYFAQNPHRELEFARFIAKHVLHRQKGNQFKAAYAWTMGHNLFSHDISDDDVKGHFYVERYKKFDKTNPFRKHKAPKKVNQKLHRGPTMASRTVMKSEDSLEFKTRLGEWKKMREEDARKPLPPDHSHSRDPGRVRDDVAIDRKDRNEEIRLALKQMAHSSGNK